MSINHASPARITHSKSFPSGIPSVVTGTSTLLDTEPLCKLVNLQDHILLPAGYYKIKLSETALEVSSEMGVCDTLAVSREAYLGRERSNSNNSK